MTHVAIVVAADDDGGIGRDGKLPWHLPEDLKRFKALTMGKPILMGRRTYDSIGRALPGRQNIVVTRRPELRIDGCMVANSLEHALRIAGDVPEVCIIGGAQIYGQGLALADVIHLTRVHARSNADTFLPPLDSTKWQEVARDDRKADARHAHDYSFITLVRRR